MSIDLDSLPEAVALYRDRAFVILELSPQLVALVESAEVVLDAPTVWWCEAFKTAFKVACGHANETGCRLVALVPVKGEE